MFKINKTVRKTIKSFKTEAKLPTKAAKNVRGGNCCDDPPPPPPNGTTMFMDFGG